MVAERELVENNFKERNYWTDVAALIKALHSQKGLNKEEQQHTENGDTTKMTVIKSTRRHDFILSYPSLGLAECHLLLEVGSGSSLKLC